LASDISKIFQNELVNTFESLLSVSVSVDRVVKASIDEIDSQVLQVKLELKNDDFSTILTFLMPTPIATKFEFFMLGGIGELKSVIDDEISDAIKEIISTIGGSLVTTINAQNFDDLKNISSSVLESNSLSSNDLQEEQNLYKFEYLFNNERLVFYIAFEENFLQYIEQLISGKKIEVESNENKEEISEENALHQSSLLNLLGEGSAENLKLLFDIKLKLSVRLGKKTFLLKDIVNWDIGHIIELEQMANEPLDILVNNVKIGEGEAVVVDGKFGVIIKSIGNNLEEGNG